MERDTPKDVVRRFNKEVIQDGNRSSFDELMDPAFINRTAPAPHNGKESMWATFANVLRPALPDLRVVIHQQIAEGEYVTTRKTIEGTHSGALFGIAPTHRNVAIDVIDIVRVHDGRYLEHWGMNTLEKVIDDLKAAHAAA